MGGLFEVGDAVVVLDDMHAVNMNRMEVETIKAADGPDTQTMHEEEEEEEEEVVNGIRTNHAPRQAHHRRGMTLLRGLEGRTSKAS